MHLGWWIRRTAAATALTLGLGLVVLNGAAFGLALPTVDPALGSETTLPSTSDLPSTSSLPVNPQQLIGPTVPETPVTSAPTGPTGPSGPAGASASGSGSSTQAQASSARLRQGKVSSTGRLRNVINGDSGSTSTASGAPAQRGRRATASSRQAKSHRRGLSSTGPGFQLFHPSQLDHLGRILGQQAAPTRLLGRFSASATGRADWAPPLLTIMLLIGLGGFLRVAMPAPRRPQ
jgi:hypothetical protein